MIEEREFDTGDVLAITHGYPVELEPYLAILTYLNQRPASTVDSREIPAAWIGHLHPALRQPPAPDVPSANPTDRDLATWDAWASDVRARIGARLTLSPIPRSLRDQRSLIELVLDRGADPNKLWPIDPAQPDLGIGDRDA